MIVLPILRKGFLFRTHLLEAVWLRGKQVSVRCRATGAVRLVPQRCRDSLPLYAREGRRDPSRFWHLADIRRDLRIRLLLTHSGHDLETLSAAGSQSLRPPICANSRLPWRTSRTSRQKSGPRFWKARCWPVSPFHRRIQAACGARSKNTSRIRPR